MKYEKFGKGNTKNVKVMAKQGAKNVKLLIKAGIKNVKLTLNGKVKMQEISHFYILFIKVA